MRLNQGCKQTCGEVRPRRCIQIHGAFVILFGGGRRPVPQLGAHLPSIWGAFPPEGALLLETPLDFLNPGVPKIPRTSDCPPGVPAQLLSSRRFPGLRGCCLPDTAVYRQELFGVPNGRSDGPIPSIPSLLCSNKLEWYIVTIILLRYHCNWFRYMIDQPDQTVA